MKKIDFHTHILPEMDDGAENTDMSSNMLDELRKQSVDTVICTPHYYSHKEPLSDFLERREHSMGKLLPSLQCNAMDVRVGAEVYFSEYLFNNKNLKKLCIDGTNTMLVELPFSRKIDERLLAHLDRLCYEYAITPVLAHIERYPEILKSGKLQERLLDLGCVFQVNLSSFTEFGKRKLLSLARRGLIGAIGTDTHNLSTRKPCYNEGYRFLERHLSEEELQYIQTTMQWLLSKND